MKHKQFEEKQKTNEINGKNYLNLCIGKNGQSHLQRAIENQKLSDMQFYLYDDET